MTSINSHFYKENLYYDNQHPQLTGAAYTVASDFSYNGNINAITHNVLGSRFSNYSSGIGIMDSATIYGYKYDGLNRLVAGDASVMNVLTNTFNPTNPKRLYGDENYTYDRLGNILTLQRGQYYAPTVTSPANQVDNWSYGFAANKNQLTSIFSGTTIVRSYTFNPNGSETRQLIGTAFNNTYYTRSNLVRKAEVGTGTTVATAIEYQYDAGDNRVYKVDNSGNTTYYLRDASGKEVATYDGLSWIYYIYGRERIGSVVGNTFNYFVTDHLGSLRADYSLRFAGCSIVTISANSIQDYYPYGKTLRSFYANVVEKYGYQGSERNIELDNSEYTTFYRALVVDVGRWNQRDPKPNFAMSPYVSMEGNPIMFNDVMGDTIKFSDEFKKSKMLTLAFQKFSETDAGKEFLKDYGIGGKYEKATVLFDEYTDKDYSKWGSAGGATFAYAKDSKTGKIRNVMAGASGTDPDGNEYTQSVKKTDILTYRIAIVNMDYTNDYSGQFNLATEVLRLTHEKQHVNVYQQSFDGTGHTPSEDQHLTLMDIGYVKERIDVFAKYFKKATVDYFVKFQIPYYKKMGIPYDAGKDFRTFLFLQVNQGIRNDIYSNQTK